MLALQIFVALSYIVNACYSTRLPLEVYELKTTHSSVAIGVGDANANVAAATGANHLNAAATTTNKANQPTDKQHQQNLEYSIAEELHNPNVQTAKVSYQIQNNNNKKNDSNTNVEHNNQQHHHQSTHAVNSDYDKDNDSYEDYGDEQTPIFKSLLNKESQTDHRRSRQMLSSHKYHTIGVDETQGSSSSSIARDHHLKDVRILYQVGVSSESFFIKF